MLKLIDLNKFTNSLIPVTSPEYFIGRTTTFHREGLFSEQIFGALETPERRKTYSFVNLNCKVMHPALYPIIRRLKKNILVAMSGEKSFNLVDGDLVEDENGTIMGMASMIDAFPKIKFRGDTPARQDMIDMIQFYMKKDQVFIDKQLIIPPTYRELTIGDDGDITVNPINDYYLKVIRLADQITSVSAGPVFDVLSYRMNEFVKELYVYLTSKISKKRGLLRNNILGKRVDFTARAVISGAAGSIRPDELGIPFKTLIKLFEPFIIYELLNSGRTPKEQLAAELEAFDNSKLSALTLRRLFIAISKHDEVPEVLRNILKEATIRAIQGKIVLAKRDPSLHAESVQAFKPVLVEGNTIQIHPIKCSSYNADFDGDTMAVYVPVTRQAIEEAKDKMLVSISKDGMDKIGDSFDKDSAIGIFILTQTPKKKPTGKLPVIKSEDDLTGLDISRWVKYGSETTTVGRIIFNQSLPDKFPKFINQAISQGKLNDLANYIYNKYDKETYLVFADKICKVSFKYGTLGSISFSMDDLRIPKEIENMKADLKNAKSDVEAQKIIELMTTKLEKYLVAKGGNLGTLGEAGALKGGYDQARQILVAKGLIADNTGKILDPIAESYTQGFESKDFFQSGAGSRRGIADRVLNTAETGYLSRQLVYALQRVEANPSKLNCGTTRGFMLKITNDISRRLKGRYYLNNTNRPVPFDATKAIGKIVKLKSPLYCLAPKICATCYGDLLKRNRTQYVGMLAGQIFGERGTQLIMKTFHTGGAVSVQTMDAIKEITDPLAQKEVNFVKKNFSQKDSIVSAKFDGAIVIRRSLFLSKNDIVVTKDSITLAYGYFNILNKEKTANIDIALDAEVIIPLADKKVSNDDEYVVVEFGAGSQIMDIPPITDNFLDKVKIIKHLLSGKKPFKSADHFAMKIFEQYGPLATSSDMIHFEVMASQLLRDKTNPSYPARLNKNYSPVVVSLKKIPSLESWLSALSFEDPNYAITTGLTYDRDQQESILEQIVNGNL